MIEAREVFSGVVTSLDGPYAISDAIKQEIRTVKSNLLIVAPWISKGFVDSLRSLVPAGAVINIITRVPEKIDFSFRCIDSLLIIAESRGWKVSIKCNPYVHAKLIIVDCKSYILGSCNQTDSGIYYNHEAIDVCNDQSKLTRIKDFFKGLWELPENVTFEQVKRLHGYRTIDKQYVRKEIADRILGYFLSNNNQSIHKWKLCKEIQRMGYSESDVISTLKDLCADGVLYEPNIDSYRMVND